MNHKPDHLTEAAWEALAARSEDRVYFIYLVQIITRKSLGEMTRKLSVTESRNLCQFRGTFSRRNSSVAAANWAQVA